MGEVGKADLPEIVVEFAARLLNTRNTVDAFAGKDALRMRFREEEAAREHPAA